MTHRFLIRGGLVVRVEQGAADLPKGDVLVEDGRITAIEQDIAAPDAEIIDARGMLVMPGFIDTHRHTWQTALRHRGAGWSLGDYFVNVFERTGRRMRPRDVYAGTLFAALGALDSGVTTLLDWSHVQNSPAHSDAAIDALADAGLRAVFGHGWSIHAMAPRGARSELPHSQDLRRIRRARLSGDEGMVTLAMAARGPDYSTDDATAQDFVMARELGLRITAHVSTGEPKPENRGVDRLLERGLLGPDLTIVHAAGASDAALRAMADHGVTVSVAPQIELGMPGLGTPILGRMLAAGLTPSLSADSETAAAGDMFTQMRAALASHQASRLQPDREKVPAISPRDVLSWATLQGARATGLERRTGSLAVGKDADIVLLRATDPNLFPVSDGLAAEALVLAAHPGNIDTVLVRGRIRKQHGRLHADLERARGLLAASREYLMGE